MCRVVSLFLRMRLCHLQDSRSLLLTILISFFFFTDAKLSGLIYKRANSKRRLYIHVYIYIYMSILGCSQARLLYIHTNIQINTQSRHTWEAVAQSRTYFEVELVSFSFFKSIWHGCYLLNERRNITIFLLLIDFFIFDAVDHFKFFWSTYWFSHLDKQTSCFGWLRCVSVSSFHCISILDLNQHTSLLKDNGEGERKREGLCWWTSHCSHSSCYLLLF